MKRRRQLKDTCRCSLLRRFLLLFLGKPTRLKIHPLFCTSNMLLPVALLVIAAWTQSAVAQSFVGDQCYSHDGSEAPGCHRRRLVDLPANRWL